MAIVDCHGRDRRRRHLPEDFGGRCRHVHRPIGRHPFEQVSSGHENTEHRAGDGVDHHEALMQEKNCREQGLTCAGLEVRAFGQDVLAQRHAVDAVPQRTPHLHVRREGQDQQPDAGPHQHGSRQHRPPGEKKCHQGGGQQAAPQVVENLPARNDRQRVRHRAATLVAHGTPQPAHDLPVAPDPAVLPRGERQVVRGIVIDEMDVGAQARSRVHALEQVVAEQRVGRNAPVERGAEGVDVVDALANVAAFVEEVLIDVGDRGGIRIEADVAGEDLRERRAVGALDAHLDPRLQHAIALGHAAKAGVETWTVERVRQRAHQTARRLHRELRVGVERDDVPHRLQDGKVATRRARSSCRSPHAAAD